MIDAKATDLTKLIDIARQLRLDILDMTTKAGSGHPSSSFSSVEILTALYFGGVLRYKPEDPWWPERDRFIMSKGHAAPLLYAVLAQAGYFDREMLWHLREINSPVQGHPILGLLPGVEATTGSLGQGLSLGVGHALGARLNRLDYRVYVLLGDGECEAGQIWEAAIAAAHFKTGCLTAILDYNKYQETGPISREMALEPLVAKWKSFGWRVSEVDGHDVEAIIQALENVRFKNDRPSTDGSADVRTSAGDQPSIIIAHTTKGKGVSFVEADYTFHGRALKPEQAARAREELLCL
jgi:transketolase